MVTFWCISKILSHTHTVHQAINETTEKVILWEIACHFLCLGPVFLEVVHFDGGISP